MQDDAHAQTSRTGPRNGRLCEDSRCWWQILDTSKQGEVDLLCQQYDGFYHLAKLLESLAQVIADGAIVVTPEENRPAV